jgi:hypothetical protein
MEGRTIRLSYKWENEGKSYGFQSVRSIDRSRNGCMRTILGYGKYYIK